MLFYNHKKEFLGLNEEALRLLNYDTMPDLLAVVSDVADLFAKDPGYIHNFKHLSWIDFLLHADSDAKHAIIHGNNRVFSCELNVKQFFLVDSPENPGFIVELLHVKTLSGEEAKPFSSPSKPSPEVFVEAPVSIPEPATPTLPDYGHITPTVLSEPSTFDVPLEEETSLDHMEELYKNYPSPEPEKEFAPLSDFEDIYAETAPAAQPTPHITEPAVKASAPAASFTPAEQVFIDQLKTDASYQFDPSVAANELGLPVDLIEEFIGDFIQQSHDFQDELFEACLKGDFNNIKILSHKLKGVAANLRIEDALEVLSIVNTSSDITEIEACLKYFYILVAKLEGKDVSQISAPSDISHDDFSAPVSDVPVKTYVNEPTPVRTVSIDDDIYDFGLKQDESPSILVQPEDIVAAQENFTEDFSSKKTIEEEIPGNLELSDPVIEEPAVTLHYDRAITAGSLGIDLGFFDELVEDYKKDAQSTLSAIIDAINAFDTHTWQEHAATLKGISDNLRLNEISQELAILSVTNDAQEAKRASKHLKEFLAQL